MAERQTFEVLERVDDEWIPLAEYSGFGSEPFLKATLHRERLVQSLPDQSRYKVVNQNGQQWWSTKMTK